MIDLSALNTLCYQHLNTDTCNKSIKSLWCIFHELFLFHDSLLASDFTDLLQVFFLFTVLLVASSKQWRKQDQILKTKTTVCKQRHLADLTFKYVNATVDLHSSDVPIPE